MYIPAGTLLCYGTRLVVALHYSREGRGVVSRLDHRLHFSLPKSFRPQHGLEVDLASNRHDYQGYLLEVKAAGA
jgi:hypothetical protein